MVLTEKQPRLRSIWLGLYSGLGFLPLRIAEDLKVPIGTFLIGTGFLAMSIVITILGSFGIVLSGFAGYMAPSDKAMSTINSQE